MRKATMAVAILCLGSIAAIAEQPTATWVGTWGVPPMANAVNPGQPQPADSTYRNIIHTTLGGSAFRIELTNEFGTLPLKVGAAHVALSAGNGSIQPGSDHALTFDGQPEVIIPAGALVLSDPVETPLHAESDLAISVYLPEQPIRTTSCHDLGVSTNYVFPGDATTSANAEAARTIESWCFVKGVDVRPEHPGKAAAVVTIGDSITDGAHSTPDANHRWPDILAQRLRANPATANLSVLNEAISGNRLLSDGAGPNALSRFDRDVIAQSGVKYLIILEGINDIGSITRPQRLDEIGATESDIIFALNQMVTRAHQHGIKVFGGTITPYEGAGYFSERGEQIRTAVNHWIRTSGVFDGVVDFDKATRDPAKPGFFSSAVDSTDHLHPGDAGYKIMGDAVDLSLFR